MPGKIKKMTFREFKAIYSRVPRLTVEVVVRTKEGVVLTRRKIAPGRGLWHIPGGTVLKGERLEETVMRVAQEELGLDVTIKKQLGVLEYDESLKGYFSQPVGVVYLVRASSRPVRINQDATDYGIFKKLPRQMMPEQRKFLKEFL